jgi:hypothetical protein
MATSVVTRLVDHLGFNCSGDLLVVLDAQLRKGDKALDPRLRLSTLAQAAAELGMSLRTARRREAAGLMPRRKKFSRTWKYARADVLKLREALRDPRRNLIEAHLSEDDRRTDRRVSE